MKLLDLFTGGGDCAEGYRQAGFEVTGVDIVEPSNYPNNIRFIRYDALDYLEKHWHEYDVITASPPCKIHTSMMNIRIDCDYQRSQHFDLVVPVRTMLQVFDKPYVIENVKASILVNPIMLCGVMFNLKVLRHRYFESSIFLEQPFHNKHMGSVNAGDYCGVYGMGGAMKIDGTNERRKGSRKTQDWRNAMGIDWMSRYELTQAIPPAYTYYIGRQIYETLAASGNRT